MSFGFAIIKYLTLYRRLWVYIDSVHRRKLLLQFVLMVLVAIAEVASLGSVVPFLGALINPERIYSNSKLHPVFNVLELNSPGDLLISITTLFCGLIVVAAILRLVLLNMSVRLSYSIGSNVSIRMYAAILHQPYRVHIYRNSSDVINLVSNKSHSVVYGAIAPVLTLLSSFVILFIMMAALIAIDPLVAAISVGGFGVIYLLLALVTKRKLYSDGVIIAKESANVLRALQEGLGGIRDTLIDGTQAEYVRMYEEADRRLRYAQGNSQIFSSGPRYLVEASAMLLISGLAVSMVQHGDGMSLAIPVLGALAMCAQRIIPLMQQSYAAWTSMRSGQSALSDTLDILDYSCQAPTNQNDATIDDIHEGIVVNRLSYRYGDGLPWVFRNISFKIPKGARVGIIGSTGSGKSTLIDVMMGLLDATEGMIAVGNVPLSKSTVRSWQNQIAHVPQAVFLAERSIAENVAFGVAQADIDYERVRTCAYKAQISSVIEKLEHGYGTNVGERGIQLSGGQRQRIGIARALYKRASVLFFDEATSALDTETEESVMKAIDSVGDEITVIIVAHRLSTLKMCDYVFELSNGSLSEVTPG